LSNEVSWINKKASGNQIMVNSAATGMTSSRTARTETEPDQPTKTRCPRECPDEENGNRQIRYFLGKAGSNGEIPAFEKEKRTRRRPGTSESMQTRIPTRERAALERLIRIAQATTGQGQMTADFLLSWWNARQFGGLDLTKLWDVAPEIAADMVTVFAWVAKIRRFPDDLGYDDEFRRIVHTWRPMQKPFLHKQEELSCVLAS
jgi:hypothetical protein